ncbi:hypothetical protein LPB41_29335 [Thalassospira sp. MA62]|nr:hypothetical protein [Thalassospira sp. MA62]
MNPILFKTLLALNSSNSRSAPGGSAGVDAQLRNRAVLYPDEPIDLPDWGIAGLPSMILGAAPQTCLFVSNLSVSPPKDDADKPAQSTSGSDADTNADPSSASGSVSFCLTVNSPPADKTALTSRQITWNLTMPISAFRDVQTSSTSAAIHAPVIRTRMQLRGVDRDIEIGLLEMAGMDQPLLIGRDTLGDKFLIRPDRDKSDETPASPSVDLSGNKTQAAKDTANTTPSPSQATNSPPTTTEGDSPAPKQVPAASAPAPAAPTSGAAEGTTAQTPSPTTVPDAAAPVAPAAPTADPSTATPPVQAPQKQTQPASPVGVATTTAAASQAQNPAPTSPAPTQGATSAPAATETTAAATPPVPTAPDPSSNSVATNGQTSPPAPDNPAPSVDDASRQTPPAQS